MKAHFDYVWSTEADNAFNDIKWSITQVSMLQLFNPKKDTIIIADLNMKGLGCTLMHDEKTQYAMFVVLSQKQSRYSNTERELHQEYNVYSCA